MWCLGVDVLGCQQFCDQIYTIQPECTFFIFDYKQELCDLFDYPKEDFISSCNRVGGPTEPDIDTCTEEAVIDADPCIVSIESELCFKGNNWIYLITNILQFFTQGYCTYTGGLLDNLIMVPDESACQSACAFDTDCSYFIYNKLENDCKMYDSMARDCDLIRGTPTPPYGDLDCETNHTMIWNKH